MAAPYIHAQSSARRWGGTPDDYLDIHCLLDSSKATFPDNRHRALTHNSWFSQHIIPLVFGHYRINSAGKKYSTKDVAEQHIREDFRNKFLPSVQDYLQHMALRAWMNNAVGNNRPDSCKNKAVKPTLLSRLFSITRIKRTR